MGVPQNHPFLDGIFCVRLTMNRIHNEICGRSHSPGRRIDAWQVRLTFTIVFFFNQPNMLIYRTKKWQQCDLNTFWNFNNQFKHQNTVFLPGRKDVFTPTGNRSSRWVFNRGYFCSFQMFPGPCTSRKVGKIATCSLHMPTLLQSFHIDLAGGN